MFHLLVLYKCRTIIESARLDPSCRPFMGPWRPLRVHQTWASTFLSASNPPIRTAPKATAQAVIATKMEEKSTLKTKGRRSLHLHHGRKPTSTAQQTSRALQAQDTHVETAVASSAPVRSLWLICGVSTARWMSNFILIEKCWIWSRCPVLRFLSGNGFAMETHIHTHKRKPYWKRPPLTFIQTTEAHFLHSEDKAVEAFLWVPYAVSHSYCRSWRSTHVDSVTSPSGPPTVFVDTTASNTRGCGGSTPAREYTHSSFRTHGPAWSQMVQIHALSKRLMCITVQVIVLYEQELPSQPHQEGFCCSWWS